MRDDLCRETANAAFRRRAADVYWTSLAIAAVLHFLVLAFWPAMTVADVTRSSDAIPVYDLPPDVVVPPAPERITRPVMPVPVTTLDADATIPTIDFREYRPQPLPPPPTTSRERLPELGEVVPVTVYPRLLNAAAVERALLQAYPAMLRDAGIGGSVRMHFLIADDGSVLRTQLAASSGYAALDAAAEKVTAMMRFSPALNRSTPVAVWVEVPLLFRAR